MEFHFGGPAFLSFRVTRTALFFLYTYHMYRVTVEIPPHRFSAFVEILKDGWVCLTDAFFAGYEVSKYLVGLTGIELQYYWDSISDMWRCGQFYFI